MPEDGKGGQSYSFDIPVAIPGTAVAGTYILGLWLPDANAQLKTLPAYSVQFANTTSSENTQIWESSTGINILTNNLQVTTGSGSLPGDTNGDGAVNLTDLATLLANFGGNGSGDVTGDGRVNLQDLALLLSNFGALN